MRRRGLCSLPRAVLGRECSRFSLTSVDQWWIGREGGRGSYGEHFASAYCVYVEGDKDEDRGGGGGCCAGFDRVVDGRIFGLGDESHLFFYCY